MTDVPLVVDLDGTLVATDTLLEGVVALVRENPFYLFALPWWAVRGRANLKRRVASRTYVVATLLPYRRDVLAYLRDERKRGRTLVLATAADQAIAQAIAQHLGFFSAVVASDGVVNMSGKQKARHLCQQFGERGFDYLGNSWRDIVVWRHARQALVAGMPALIIRLARRTLSFQHVFEERKRWYVVLPRLLRCRQWIKNVLIFVPLLAAHRFTDGAAVMFSLGAFMAFNLTASVVYIINDLLDVHVDRLHSLKRYRPLAAGDISPWVALAVIPLNLFAAAVVTWFLPPDFVNFLLIYLVLSSVYSLYLKRVVLVDVIVLAMLYTVRIFAGAAAVQVPVSSWLAAFALFMFFSLALLKRFCELQRLHNEQCTTSDGRGYIVSDIQPISFLGIASGLLSVVVFTLYITSREVAVLYTQPHLLWLIAPLLLYWIGRVWLLAYRGSVHEDPLVFAMKDMASYAVGGLAIVVMLLAI